MHGEGIAGEQHVDVAGADQFLEVLRAAGVNDDRAGDDRDAAAGRLDVAQHRGDARDADLDPPLR